MDQNTINAVKELIRTNTCSLDFIIKQIENDEYSLVDPRSTIEKLKFCKAQLNDLMDDVDELMQTEEELKTECEESQLGHVELG